MPPAKKSASTKRAAKTTTSANKANPPAKKAAKVAPRPTVTLGSIATEWGEAHSLASKQAERLLSDFLTRTAQHLQRGNKIRLLGLGIFEVRERPARTAYNPATGEPMQVKASKKVMFRAAKILKESL